MDANWGVLRKAMSYRLALGACSWLLFVGEYYERIIPHVWLLADRTGSLGAVTHEPRGSARKKCPLLRKPVHSRNRRRRIREK